MDEGPRYRLTSLSIAMCANIAQLFLTKIKKNKENTIIFHRILVDFLTNCSYSVMKDSATAIEDSSPARRENSNQREYKLIINNLNEHNMDKTLRYSCVDGLQGVKQAYLKPCVKTRGIEAGNLLNVSADSTVDSDDLNHGDGGALAPKDNNFNLWED